jgi:outer membrane biosynthesis protein TonB
MKKIAIYVTSAHLLLIFMLLFSPVKKNPGPRKHIAVRMIQPRSKTEAVAIMRAPKKAAAASAPAAAPSPIKAPKKEVPKKETPKTNAKNKTAASKAAPIKSKPIAPQKKPAVVETGKPKKIKPPPARVLQEIDEALAKIDDKVYSRPQSKLDVPQVRGSAPVELPFFEFEGLEPGTHEEALISFLHDSLKLPEFGEVKIQLTVHKDGSVARLVVLKAESPKNKAYLEKNLLLLKLPLILDKEKTFTLTFCNEI